MAQRASDTPERFDLRIVADFGAAPGSAGEWARVEAGQLPALFLRLAPRFELRTEDLLSGADRIVAWRLAPSAVRDFEPNALLAAFPVSAPLLAWRDRLAEVMRSGAGLPGLLDSLESLWPDVPPLAALPGHAKGERGAGPAPRAGAGAHARRGLGGSGVDALLDMVDVGGAQTRPPKAPADGSAPQADASTGPAPLDVRERLRALLDLPSLSPDMRLRQARTAVEEALGRQAEAILHDPALRDREAAWRCLWSVVEGADLRRGDLRLHVASAAAAQVPEALERLSRAGQESWAASAQAAALVIDHPVGGADESSALIDEAIRLAVRPGCTVALPLQPALLGRGGDPAAARPGSISELAASEPVARLGELLARAGVRSFSVTCNRFLFRPLYDPAEAPSSLGGLRERAGHPNAPFANAPWIAARGIAQAVRLGGPVAAKALDAAEICGIPLRPLGGLDAPEHLLALEFMLGVGDARRLLDAGLAPLTCEPDEDRVVLRGLRHAAASDRDASSGAAHPESLAERSGAGGSMAARFTIQTAAPNEEVRPASPEEKEREGS